MQRSSTDPFAWPLPDASTRQQKAAAGSASAAAERTRSNAAEEAESVGAR